jgi:hypothetical protein
MPTRLPKRCNSTRPIGNRPQVGNLPYIKTPFFMDFCRPLAVRNRPQKAMVCPTAGLPRHQRHDLRATTLFRRLNRLRIARYQQAWVVLQ